MADVDGRDAVLRVPSRFETFCTEEYSRVVGLVYGLSGNASVAEDLALEAFLRAHRDWDRVAAMASPSAWVRRVAINLAISRFRRLRSEARLRLRLRSQTTAFDVPAVEHEAFWAEVRRLPDRQAQAIALHDIDDISVAEIAAVLEVAEGTVKALLHQGRTRLARRLTSKGWVDDGR